MSMLSLMPCSDMGGAIFLHAAKHRKDSRYQESRSLEESLAKSKPLGDPCKDEGMMGKYSSPGTLSRSLLYSMWVAIFQLDPHRTKDTGRSLPFLSSLFELGV